MSIAEQLEERIREHGRLLRDSAEERALEALINAAPDGPPRDEGGIKLRDSMRAVPFERGNVVGTEVSANADHAEMVSEGTRPHIIRPSRGKVLRFEVGGEVIYAREVHHPGVTANEYFQMTVDRWGEFLQAATLDF